MWPEVQGSGKVYVWAKIRGSGKACEWLRVPAWGKASKLDMACRSVEWSGAAVRTYKPP